MTFKSNLAILASSILLFAAPASADWQPSGPINMQIGFDAGGETDTIGRVVAATIEEQTGWKFVVENKPGGGGVAMFTGIAVAPADGSVIGMGVNMPIMLNLVLRGDKLPFKLDSFDYLATVSRAQLAIIAKKDAPFNNMKELIDYSKANGGVAIAFDAKPQELILQAIEKKEKAGFKLVSTKSSAEMMQYILGGQVVASFNAGTHIPYLEKGDIKMLASANDGRHNYAPDVPSLKEQGYDLYVDPYFYFAGPAGMPADAKAALAAALDKAINSDKVKQLLANSYATEPRNLGPEGTAKMLVDGIDLVKTLTTQ